MSTIIRSFVHGGGNNMKAGQAQHYGNPDTVQNRDPYAMRPFTGKAFIEGSNMKPPARPQRKPSTLNMFGRQGSGEQLPSLQPRQHTPEYKAWLRQSQIMQTKKMRDDIARGTGTPSQYGTGQAGLKKWYSEVEEKRNLAARGQNGGGVKYYTDMMNAIQSSPTFWSQGGAPSAYEAERRSAQELTAQGWSWGGNAGGWRPPKNNPKATYTPSFNATYAPPKNGYTPPPKPKPLPNGAPNKMGWLYGQGSQSAPDKMKWLYGG